jgi:hypothetical protein
MTNRKLSQAQEKSAAKQLNGRVTAASGATVFAKGDVRCDAFLVECKATRQRAYVLRYSTWEKIEREALKDGLRIPLMCVDMQGRRCYICDTALLIDLPRDDAHLLYIHDAIENPYVVECKKQKQVCGEFEVVVFSTQTKQQKLAVLPEYDFLYYVLPKIGGFYGYY